MAGPALRLLGREDGLVKRSADVIIAEPRGDLADGGAVGVVEVVTRCEDLDSLGSRALEGVEHARVETLGKEDVSRDSGLHPEFKGTTGGCVEISS